MDESIAGFKRQYFRFYRQALQLYPKIDIPDEYFLRNITNQTLLYKTLFADNVLKHKLPASYQIRVLKELLSKIEKSIYDWNKDEISNDLMNSLSDLLASRPSSEASLTQQKSYVTYTLSSLSNNSFHKSESSSLATRTFVSLDSQPATVTLLESHTLLSASGTTGFRTWEAALHLGDYLCSHPELVSGKRILELGSGTAYISILCALHLKASHVLATDGSLLIIATHPTNFNLNYLCSPGQISSKQLSWGQQLGKLESYTESKFGHRIDLVLGADILYDDIGISALLKTFVDLFNFFPGVMVLISATVRKEETINSFLNGCKDKKWIIQRVVWDVKSEKNQEGPFFEVKAEINMFFITKSC